MKVSLYLPDSLHNEEMNHNELVEIIAGLFCDNFGGCTAEMTQGYYMRKDNGKVDKETTTILHTFVNEEGIYIINEIAAVLKDKYKQESVLITIDRNISAKFI